MAQEIIRLPVHGSLCCFHHNESKKAHSTPKNAKTMKHSQARFVESQGLDSENAYKFSQVVSSVITVDVDIKVSF